MHELVHVLLRKGGICDLIDTPMSVNSSADLIERFCSEVAAAILIPRNLVLSMDLVSDAAPSCRWKYEELHSLSRRFGVSAEAMLLRLVTLGRASLDYYWERRQEFFQHATSDYKGKAGGGNYYRNTIHALGRGYISTVWNSYQREEINAAELTRYLGVKYKNIRKLVETMGEE